MLKYIDFVNLWGCVVLASSCGAGIWWTLSFMADSGWRSTAICCLAVIGAVALDELYQELKTSKEYAEYVEKIGESGN
jgi:hypothetical protein